MTDWLFVCDVCVCPWCLVCCCWDMVVTVTIIDPPGVPDLASIKHFVRERRLLGEWEALTLWQTGLCFTPHVPRIHFYCSCKCFLISTVYFKMKDQPVSNIILTCHIINLASVFYLIIIEKRRIKGCLPARAHSVQPNARSICGECLTLLNINISQTVMSHWIQDRCFFYWLNQHEQAFACFAQANINASLSLLFAFICFCASF